MPVNVTETAARKIHEIVREQELNPDAVYLRVGVKGGGCSGFNYILDLTEVKKDSDEVFEFTYDVPTASAGEADAGNAGAAIGASGSGNVAVAAPAGAMEKYTLRVICDPKSYLYLNGTTIDFKTDGMLHSGFAFNNPNATSSCGCGSSFSA